MGSVSVGNVPYSLSFRFASNFRRVQGAELMPQLTMPMPALAIEYSQQGPEIVEVGNSILERSTSESTNVAGGSGSLNGGAGPSNDLELLSTTQSTTKKRKRDVNPDNKKNAAVGSKQGSKRKSERVEV